MPEQTQAAERIPLSRDTRRKAHNRPVLTREGLAVAYHEVLPSQSGYRYRVTTKQFREHLALLVNNATSFPNKPKPRVTFDDGHRSNYEHALPLLNQSGLKATFFVLAGSVGTGHDYISWSQAREIVAAGHQVQSHGWSHRLLTRCSSGELENEVRRSKEELESRLGVQVDSISVPGGRWDMRVVEACADAGYTYVFHSNPWISARMSNGILIRGRLMVTRWMDASILNKRINPTRLSLLFLRVKQGAKEDFRGLLGDEKYHRLWRWFAKWENQTGMEVTIGKAERKDKAEKR